MNRKQLQELLQSVRENNTSIEQAVNNIAATAIHSSEVAQLDLHRELRCGAPEAVFCEGKTVEQCVTIAGQFVEAKHTALFTRCTAQQAEAVLAVLESGEYFPDARCITYCPNGSLNLAHDVVVVCAGTSDLPVAREATVTLNWLGCNAELISDVGVAGIHRVLEKSVRLRTAECVIVVAGMEGALCSVVAGLVASPVIALPTSIGYGASYEGLAALLAMLNSCSPGVAVVNIDNGFGAAMMAARIVNPARNLQE
ncbi:MAG TPA: nickel pincer cofactor biosynthesis protein LarB [Planctomycetes bacterium]|jgi:NCAIR mutase (PurE)-related protein|nr:nickel pincer cofactor biosynthesis protein LarB [Planctomycetota bacterium]